MNNTTHTQNSAATLDKAIQSIAHDMQTRGFGAIIWSIPDAGFHYIPEIQTTSPRNGKTRTARITGLYAFNDQLWAIEEDHSGITIEDFYRPGVDVPPVVVTLSENKARESFSTPTEANGFTRQGTLEEWTAIADCYFEALAED